MLKDGSKILLILDFARILLIFLDPLQGGPIVSLSLLSSLSSQFVSWLVGQLVTVFLQSGSKDFSDFLHKVFLGGPHELLTCFTYVCSSVFSVYVDAFPMASKLMIYKKLQSQGYTWSGGYQNLSTMFVWTFVSACRTHCDIFISALDCTVVLGFHWLCLAVNLSWQRQFPVVITLTAPIGFLRFS